jgi:transposase
MSAGKELSVRGRIGSFYLKNKQMKKNEIVRHFVLEGIASKTVYRSINRINNGISLIRKPGSGSNRKISDKIKEKIIEQNVNEVGQSYRSIGRKHKIHHQSAKRILDEAEVIRKKRKKAPKSNENQKIRQKKCLQKFRRTLLKPSNHSEVVMDLTLQLMDLILMAMIIITHTMD